MENTEKKIMTCVTCPVGCEMTVEYETSADGINKKLINVSGNTCKRGEKYAADEIQNPRRTVTSTIPVENGTNIKFLPVKTSKPIAKSKVFEAMEIINRQKAKLPIKTGDIICNDFTEKGINLIACRDIE